MVKTRSKGDLTEEEVKYDAEQEIQGIKGELADLRGDITEIKNFLKRICPVEPTIPTTTKVNESETHTVIPTVNTVEQKEARETQVPQIFKMNFSPKGQGDMSNEQCPGPVQFAIEHNTVDHCASSVNPTMMGPTTTLAQQDHRPGMHSGVMNSVPAGNPYGIDWNHSFFQHNQCNPVTGQLVSARATGNLPGVHVREDPRSNYIRDPGINSSYAEAIIKGPRLEIQLFSGEDPIGWLKQCERFYELSGTPVEQWVNLASGHLQGRASNWFTGIGVPWQVLSWNQFCAMIRDRFSEVNAHDAVEQLHNIKQGVANVSNYIDRFEECMSLVKRDHPYLQEAFLMSCFIGGLRGEIKRCQWTTTSRNVRSLLVRQNL